MKIRSINPGSAGPGLAALVLLAAPPAFAQTDEIQVYDAEIAEQGVFNLMIHSNYTPIGRTKPDFPGAIIANQSENGAAEWAYGVAPWFEQGLYLPVYSLHSENHGTTVNGFKLRELFVRPNAAEHTFFYGVNFEFSANKLYWEPKRITSEIRPIVGVHLHPIDLILNPILDTDYTGGFRGLQFNPAARIAYNLPREWAVAVEWYGGFGPLGNFAAVDNQFHEVWAVVDHNTKVVNIETGVGVGMTAGADRLTLKLMVSRDLNSRKQQLKRPIAPGEPAAGGVFATNTPTRGESHSQRPKRAGMHLDMVNRHPGSSGAFYARRGPSCTGLIGINGLTMSRIFGRNTRARAQPKDRQGSDRAASRGQSESGGAGATGPCEICRYRYGCGAPDGGGKGISKSGGGRLSGLELTTIDGRVDGIDLKSFTKARPCHHGGPATRYTERRRRSRQES